MVESSPTPAPGTKRGWSEHREVGADFLGEVIDGRYQVVRRLAKGGMAHVFLAKDRTRKCHVAIKLLHHPGASARRRFEFEAQVLSNIQCDHIVRAVAFGETADGQPYLALEYLEGETLAQRLARGPLPWRDVARFGVQIATGLHALHTIGVVHRDVKPDNIIIAIGADRSVAKLIDLGLASVGASFHEAQEARFASQVSPRHKTQLGRVIGTPEYLPPEAGTCDAAPSLDVFSLGTTLYQLCTQLLPRVTGARSIHEVVAGSDAPEDLSRLLRAALEADPGDRLPSADHLRRGLEAILDAHPATAGRGHLFGGCYDKLEVIGVGASTIVHRASDRRLSREVALKVLRAADPGEDDVLRFLRAAKILSALSHPSIPRILHCGEDGKQHFAVTELCSGVPATEVMHPDRHLRADEVVAIGRQLAGALAATHAAGLVYRDLHAGNVLIARGETPRAWLFDFDQAQVSPEFYARLTERWATPPEERAEPANEKPLHRMYYAAPEVRCGGAFTPASDVFALGLLLYRLLTGLRPFPPDGGETVPPRNVCPACPSTLEHLLVSMLNPAPGTRPTLAAIETALTDAQAEIEEEAAERDESPTAIIEARSTIPARSPTSAASDDPAPTSNAALEPVPSAPATPQASDPSPPAPAPTSAAAASSVSPTQSSRTAALLGLALAVGLAMMFVFRDAPQVEVTMGEQTEPPASSSVSAPASGSTASSSTPAVAVAARVERPSAAEPEPPSPPERNMLDEASPQESAAPANTPRRKSTPAATWETRVGQAEAAARRCLDAAGIKPRRVSVTLSPSKPIEFGNVPSDSPHARCIRDAFDRLHLRSETHRRHTFFDVP